MNITYKDKMFDKNIVELVREKVNKLTDKHWNHDECKPIFITSILYHKNKDTDKIEQYIILTCQHLSSTFSRILFPQEDSFYGYESILSEMESLYNQTM
jgi:hypothetical protein